MVHRHGCFLIVPFVLAALAARASMVLPQNLERLESAAELIFVGECTSRTAKIDERGLPVNEFTFRVIESVKGPLRVGRPVTFRQLGSDVPHANGAAFRLAGLPEYRVGQEMLIFLNPKSAWGLTSPVGLSQGCFAVGRDAKQERTIRLDPLRRKTLADGVDLSQYASNERFTAAEREFLTAMPEQVSVSLFGSVIRKIGQEREQAENRSRARSTDTPAAPNAR